MHQSLSNFDSLIFDRGARSSRLARQLAIVLVVACLALHAQVPSREQSQTIITSQYGKLDVNGEIARIAVADPGILSAELISSHQLLLLGKKPGRTTVIVWLRDGQNRQYLYLVERDLSLLRSALHRIHPSIQAELATDREAVVLTGQVPDVSYSQAAELAAKNYLNASRLNTGRVYLGAGESAGNAPSDDQANDAEDQTEEASFNADKGQQTLRRGGGQNSPSGQVINLIRLENLPATVEQRIKDAVATTGGKYVNVRRIIRGASRDDSQDVLVLEGSVPNQTALVRTLTLAARLFTGNMIQASSIRVVADEGGGFLSRAGSNGSGQGSASTAGMNSGSQSSSFSQLGSSGLGSSAGIGSGIGGSSGSTSGLGNQINRNIGRAKILEAANGRIISFLTVSDLPQVRVGVRLYEVDRTKLRNYQTNTLLYNGNVANNSIDLASKDDNGNYLVTQATGSMVGNLLGMVDGVFTNELKFTAGHVSVDTMFTQLESLGIAKNLSSPTLTVLSGETAQFQVGGEIPIQESFASSANGSTGVFTSTVFQNFGIELDVRPMVGEDDMVTLDLQPQIITPDNALTSSVRSSTGSNQSTTAFQTRVLRTSTRLEDGQSLVIGGLLSRDVSDAQTSTPILRDIPGLGWLFRGMNRNDTTTELVIVLNPVLVRPVDQRVKLWQFPDTVSPARAFFENANKGG